MPKGRGSNQARRRKRKPPPPKPANLLPSTDPIVPASELQRRAQAKEAGGFSREERRRSRQRTEEAQRLAARRLEKALRKQRDDEN